MGQELPHLGATPAIPFARGLVRGLTNEAYQRGPGLSSSGLKMLRKSPWHFHAIHHLERPAWAADEFDADTTSALFAGTLCHCATLEPAAFDDRYIVGPEGVNKNSNRWREFVADNRGRQVITARQHAVAHGQAAALRALPPVVEIIDGGEFEVSAYWHDDETNLLCRCRPDVLNMTFGTPEAPAAMLLDVKTTTDASLPAIRNSIARFGYHHQAEHYSRGIESATGMPVAGFVFAFVESAYPFACRVVELDPEAYEIARRENRVAIDLCARCERLSEWPGYPTEVGFVSLPRWAGGSE